MHIDVLYSARRRILFGLAQLCSSNSVSNSLPLGRQVLERIALRDSALLSILHPCAIDAQRIRTACLDVANIVVSGLYRSLVDPEKADLFGHLGRKLLELNSVDQLLS
jgi:hypothetical protein